MATVRAFLAMNFDIAVTRRIAEVQGRLRERLGAAGWKVAWVPPPNLHLTLKFFGDVGEELAPAIADALKPVCSQRGPLRLGARGLGAFPDAERPRVVWVGVEDKDGQLGSFVARAEDRLAELGFAKEKRAFHAHVTLGRVKSAGKEALGPAMAALAPAECGESTIGEVVLYQSDLSPQGAEYTALARVPLQRRRNPEGAQGDRHGPGQ